MAAERGTILPGQLNALTQMMATAGASMGQPGAMPDSSGLLTQMLSQMQAGQAGQTGDPTALLQMAQAMMAPSSSPQAASTASLAIPTDDPSLQPTSASTPQPVRGRLASVSPKPLSGAIKKTGFAEKQGNRVKNWKKRYFQLNQHSLTYHLAPGAPPKGSIILKAVSDLQLVSSSKAPRGLAITVPQRTYVIRYQTKEQRQEWFDAIQVQLDLIAALRKPKAVRFSSSTNQGSAAVTSSTTDPWRPRGMDETRSFQLPATVLGLDESLDELLKLVMYPKPGISPIIILEGDPGSGRHTLMQCMMHAIQHKAPQITVAHEGVRRIGALQCQSCFHPQFAPLDKPEELFTTEDGDGIVTLSGDRVDTGSACDKCGSTDTRVQSFNLADDELQQLVDVNQESEDVLGAMLKCTLCECTGIPMTPQGLCRLQDGPSGLFLASITGEPLPDLDSAAWRGAIPHFMPECFTANLQVLPILFSAPLGAQLLAARSTATVARSMPHQPFLQLYHNGYLGLGRYRAGLLKMFAFALNQASNQPGPPDLEQDLATARVHLSQAISHCHQATRGRIILGMGGVGLADCGRGEDDVLLNRPSELAPCLQLIYEMDPKTSALMQVLAKSKRIPTHVIKLRCDPVHVKALLAMYLEELDAGADVAIPSTTLALCNQARPSPNPLQLRLLAWGVHHGVKMEAIDLPALLKTVVDAIEMRFEALGKAMLQYIAFTRHVPYSKEAFSFVLAMLIESDAGTVKPKLEEMFAMVRGAILCVNTTPGGQHMILNSSVFVYLKAHYLQSPEHLGVLSRAMANALKGVSQTHHLEDMSLLPNLYFDAGMLSELASLVQDWTWIQNRANQGFPLAIVEAFDLILDHQELFPGVDMEDMAFRKQFSLKNMKGLADATLARTVIQEFSSVRPSELALKAMRGAELDPADIPSKIVRIFTSSTFDDLKVERDALMARGYPHIRERLKQMGLEFQVVDMRWGIRDESTSDHATSSICMTELRQCQEVSLGLNFVTFLSQRYGYRPFPSVIEVQDFERLRPAVKDVATQSYLDRWFVRDDNVVPASYVLLPIPTHLPDYLSTDADKRRQARGDWWSAFESMALGLRQAANDVFLGTSEREQFLCQQFTFSVTEEEIRRGILHVASEERVQKCYWFKRNIVDLESAVKSGDKASGKFTDLAWGKAERDPEAAELLEKLRASELPQSLKEDLITEYNINYAAEKGVDYEREDHKIYIDGFVNDFSALLISTSEAALKAQEAKLSGDHLLEALLIESTWLSGFKVTLDASNPLEKQLLDYLTGPSGLPFVLFGSSGSGKSVLSAKMAASVRKLFPKQLVLVVRRCGSSAVSTTTFALIRSLFQQLASATGLPVSSPDTFQELGAAFKRLLHTTSANHNITLILDGLDRLHDFRELSLWLPLQLPVRCKVLVTCSTEKQQVAASLLRHIYGQLGFENNLTTIPPLDRAMGEVVMDYCLQDQSRRLTTPQREACLRPALHSNAKALDIKLTLDISRKWRSFEAIDPLSIPTTTKELFNMLLDQLERTHGRMLVSHALAFLTISADGIMDTELEDLLCLDDDVLNDVFQYWTPPERRIPPLLLIRLRRDLTGYIASFTNRQGSPVYKWAHVELGDIVLERYFGVQTVSKALASDHLDVPALKTNANLRNAMLSMTTRIDEEELHQDLPQSLQKLHGLCAEYFSGIWASTPKPYTDKDGSQKEAFRFVASMPLVLAEGYSNVNQELLHPNHRRLVELPHHLLRSNQLELLKQHLLDGRVISYMCLAGNDLAASVERARMFGLYLRAVGSTWVQFLLDAEGLFKGKASRFSELDGSERLAVLSVISGLTAMTRNFQLHTCAGWLDAAWEEIRRHSPHIVFGDTSQEEMKALLALARGDVRGAIDAAALVVMAADERGGVNQSGRMLARKFQASIHRRLRDHARAIRILQEALTLTPTLKCSEGDAALFEAAVLNELAQCYQEIGAQRQAAPLLEQALKALVACFGEHDAEVATVMHNLGCLELELGQFAKAEPLLIQSINLRQTLLGSRHPEVGRAMHSLASLYLAVSNLGQNRCADALPMLERALEICKVDEGSSAHDDDMALTSMSLAQAQRGMGQRKESIETLRSAIGRARLLKVDRDKRVADGEHTLGVFLLDDKEFGEAEQLLRSALEKREAVLGPDHPDTLSTMECVAIVLQSTGRMQESTPFVLKVQAAQQRSLLG